MFATGCKIFKWDWSKKGWHPASDLGKVIPLYKGKGKEQRPYFTYWAEIELPKED